MTAVRNSWVISWGLPANASEIADIDRYDWLPWTLADVSRWLDSDGAIYWIARDHVTRLAGGYALLLITESTVVLVKLVVHPRYRRRGLGLVLLQRALGKVNVRRHFIAFIHERNLPAQQLMRSAGVRCTEAARETYPNGDSDLLFEYFHCA